MQEDKREKVRLASDGLFSADGSFYGLAHSPIRQVTTAEINAVMNEAELQAARARAKLSVLNLTERDKKFLRALKVGY